MRRTPCLLTVIASFAFVSSMLAADPPVITQQPASQITTVGQPVNFTVNGNGSPPLTFRWWRDGSPIPGAIAPTYSLDSAQISDDAAQFQVIITNAVGGTTSSVATLTVLADLTPPTVVRVANTPDLMQIRVRFSERVRADTATDSANFFLQAMGPGVIAASLNPDGTNVALTLSGPLAEGTGYNLTIANIKDLANNSLAPDPTVITAQAAVAPSITKQPQSRAVATGDSIVLTIQASGTAPLDFRWFKGSNSLASGSDLSLNSIKPSDLGGYHCVVSNSAGVVTSAIANVSLLENYTLDLPSGYSFVANQLVNSNKPFPDPPDGTQAFKWNQAAQNFESYLYDTGQGFGFWLPQQLFVAPGEGVILNLPSPTSLTFFGQRIIPTLPVNLAPGFNLIAAQIPKAVGYLDLVGQPKEGSAVYRYLSGDPTLFTEKNYRLSYYRDGVWHDGPPKIAVGESVFVTEVTPVDITDQPVAQTNVPPGQSVSFSVTATGTPPIRYQWRLNGTRIPDGTNSTYTIQSANPGNAGIYSVSVGNVVGDVISQRAPLRLVIPAFTLSDGFIGQPVVNDVSRLFTSNNRNGTREPGEPQHAGKKANASLWFTWIAPAAGIVTFSAAGSGFDTILAAYRGNSVSNLTFIDASDDDAGYACSRIQFNARANLPYRICVAGLGDETGDILLGWNLEVTTQFLPEIAEQPKDMTVGYNDTAQFSVSVTNGNFAYQWFRDDAPIPGANGATLTLPNVTDADVGNYFVRILNQNQNRFRDSLLATLQIEVPEPGFALSGARATGKFFDIGIGGGSQGVPLKAERPPKLGGTVNHGYSGAIAVSSSGVGKDVGEPNHCGVTGGNSVWYAVQAETNGTMYVNTDGSSFNTVIAAYVGPGTSYATLTNVACDNNSGLDGLDSRASFPATANTIYYLAVDGVGGASGLVKIAFRLVRPLSVTNPVYSTNGGARYAMRINGTPNLAAIVQGSTNFNTTNWTSLITNTSSSGTFNFTNTALGGMTNRYYRALHNF